MSLLDELVFYKYTWFRLHPRYTIDLLQHRNIANALQLRKSKFGRAAALVRRIPRLLPQAAQTPGPSRSTHERHQTISSVQAAFTLEVLGKHNTTSL